MTDFRNLQHYLGQLRAAPTAEEYYLEGYSLLRRCATEAQTILQTPFAGGSSGASGDPEREKTQLQAYVPSLLYYGGWMEPKDFLAATHQMVTLGVTEIRG